MTNRKLLAAIRKNDSIVIIISILFMQCVVSLTSTSDYLQTISLTCSIVSYRPLTYREMTSMMEDGFVFLTIFATSQI